MAGYSKGIVATRKLNERNKAGLGRRGADGVKDTEIRKVDNRESHVNALEAYLIDVNGKAGEEYAKRGAGTINPLTGMPEYRSRTDTSGNEIIEVIGDNGTTQEIVVDSSGNMVDKDTNLPYVGGKSYEELKNVTGKQLKEFDESLGTEDVKYFEGIFTDKPFDFLEQQQDLTTRGLQSAYGATMGALGSQEKTLGLQREGLTAQQTALGRTIGRGLKGAREGRATAASRSGLATSGTITQAYETQKKDLFQDYTAGTQDIGRQRAGIDIAMGDISRERGTALDTLTLGKDTAAFDLSKGVYTEEQRQLDEYWEMIGQRIQAR